MTRILLPPSEGKRAGGSGPCLTELDDGSRAPLDAHRRRVARAVVRLAAGRPARAAQALLLPDGVADAALAADRVLLDSATLPALQRYAGVVYDGLDAASLTAAQRATADEVVSVFTALRGVVAGGEPVPDYRLPSAARLPRLGILATSWRPVLERVLPALFADHFVLDLRSTDYTAMWRAGPDVVAARVLSRRPDGSSMVVSYDSKRAKGRLTREVITRLAAGRAVDSADDVLAAWSALGGHDAREVRTGGRTVLDLVI